MHKQTEEVFRTQSLRRKNKNRNVRLFLPFFLASLLPSSVMAQQAYLPDGPVIPTIALTGSGAGTAIQEAPPKPSDQQSEWNMALVGHSDLQGRSAYQPIIINENGREIAYVGHHTGTAMNSLTGVVEPNGTSIIDVTDPANPKYLSHIPGSTAAGEETGGAQMVRVCSGSVLPHGIRGKWYLLRPNGVEAQEIYDVTDPAHPTRVTVIVSGLNFTQKNWWECDTGNVTRRRRRRYCDPWSHLGGSCQEPRLRSLRHGSERRYSDPGPTEVASRFREPRETDHGRNAGAAGGISDDVA